MMDLKATDKVFKSAAFEPSETDKGNYKRNQRSQKKRSSGYKSELFVKEVPDELISDSDDDLPDVAHMLDGKKGKGKQKAQVISSDDDSDVRISTLKYLLAALTILLDFDSGLL